MPEKTATYQIASTSLPPRSRTKLLWERLTAPDPLMTDPVKQKQSRFLAVLWILQTLLFVVASLASLMSFRRSGLPTSAFFVLRGAFLIYSLINYKLSRTRYFWISARIMIVTALAITFSLIIANPQYVNFAIASIIPVILLSSIFLSRRTTLVVALFSTLGILVLPVFYVQITWSSVLYLIIPLVFSTILVTVNTAFRSSLAETRQHELATSELRYRQMFEGNQAIKLVIDADTQDIVEANEAACLFYGYDHQTLLTKKITDINIMPPERITEAMASSRISNQKYTDFRHRLASGEIRDVEVYTGPIVEENKTLLFSIIHDITDRKRAEEARFKSEEQLRSLITSIDDLIFSIDLEGRFLVYHQASLNPQDTPITPPIQFVGKRYRDILPADLVNNLDVTIAKVTSTYNTNTVEYSQEIDDVTHFFSARVSPLIGARIKLNGVTVVARDITEIVRNRQRQQSLLELEKLNAQIATTFLQTDEPETEIKSILELIGALLDVSRTYIFRYREHEYVLDNTHEWCAYDVVPEIDNLQGIQLDLVIPSFTPMLTRLGIINCSDISLLPGDMQRLFNAQQIKALLILPFYVDGRLEGCIGLDEVRHIREWLPEEITILRTLTESYSRMVERQRAKLALIQARDDALRSVKIKTEFVSNMSHEVRTPMTGVIGMLELLLELPLTGEQLEYSQAAFTSAHNLLGILDDILDFSKIEAGKITLESKLIDVRDVIQEVHMTLGPQANKKNVGFMIDIPPTVPHRLYADPTRLRQILLNLVSNAIKFTDEGSVRVCVKSLPSVTGRSKLSFEVSDTGIGIAPENLSRIFGSFVQADGSITRKYGGSGLGLAITKQLVELMGGQIEVQSNVEQGSTFRVNLVLAAPAHDEPIDQTVDLSMLRVAIYDEDTTSRYLLVQQLQTWNIAPREVRNVEDVPNELVKAAESGMPFMGVFCRPQLTVEDQSVLLDNLRTRLGDKRPWFIFMGENERPVYEGIALYDMYLRRPIRPSDLFSILSSLANPGVEDRPSPVDDDSLLPVHAGEKHVLRILLAEDNTVTRDIVQRGLRRVGIQVEAVKDGREVLDLITSNGLEMTYDAILMDIHMPIMDGLTATRFIRIMDGPISKVPIIALTASVMPEERQKYLDAGVNDVIGKPFAIDKLRMSIQEWTHTLRD